MKISQHCYAITGLAFIPPWTVREYGLTQEKLAEDLQVTRHTILALEVGRYVPSIELALRLASYFKRPLESIFWLEEEIAENA